MSDTIIVNASATLAAGQGADFDVIVDGTRIGNATAGTMESGYSFNTTLSPGAPHDIEVVYTNDATANGQDRNLLLQSINVNGQTIAASSDVETYTATGNNGAVYSGDGNMYWAGSASFQLPASFFQAGTVQPVSAPTQSLAPARSSSAAATGAAFYVASSGNDAGDGSSGNPFATLGRAQQAMENSSVHTTRVEDGTYNLSSGLHLTSKDSGMSFIADSGQNPVLTGSGISLVTLDGTSNVTLQGLTFENAGGSQGAVYVVNASSNDIVANLFANNNNGVVLNGSDHNLISGNQINNSFTAGVIVGSGSGRSRFSASSNTPARLIPST